MSQVHSIACGLPFCHSSQGKQTDLSIGLRATAIVVGIIAAIGGGLILYGTPGISPLWHTVAWGAISTGGTLVLIGVSIKFVEHQSNNIHEDNNPIAKPIVPEPTKEVILTKDQILRHLPSGRFMSITIGGVDKSTNAKEKCKFNYYSKDKNGTLSENLALTYKAGLEHWDELLDSDHANISQQELIECLVQSGCPEISPKELTRILS